MSHRLSVHPVAPILSMLTQIFSKRGMSGSIGRSILLAIVLAGCHSPMGHQPQPLQSPVQTSAPLQQPTENPDPTVSSHAFQISVPLPEPVPVTKPWKITYVIKTQSHPYWQRVKQAAIDLGHDRGLEMTVIGPEDGHTKKSVESQIRLIAEHVEQNQVDGLILGPSDSIRLAPIVETLSERGIAVMTIDTPLDTEAVLTFVGFDNFAAGEAMGKWVIQHWAAQAQAESSAPRPPKILMLEGARHNDNALERHAGFLAGLNTGEVELLATRSANWSRAEAQEITHQWLQQYPHIDVIMAANDEMALGAIAAMTEQNRTDILVTGFDGSQVGLLAIESGTLAATIAQIPEPQTQMTIELMIHHLEHQTTLPPTVLLETRKVITPFQSYDSQN